MVKLSIISPTYHCVDRIRRHIESVQNQTFRNFEHIIIDNLSTDGTEEVVDAYRKAADFPVIYVRERDRGIYEATNKGIRKARGEWIHVLNSDNAYHTERSLENVFKEDLEDFDVVACGELLLKKKQWIQSGLLYETGI